MKKIYSTFAFLLLCFGLNAQSTPNGGFELWNSTSCDGLTGYTNSNGESVFRCNTGCNATKSSDAYNGSFALELNTFVGAGDTCFGYVVNSMNPQGQNPCMWPGGMPYSSMATGIRGYYKSAITAPDSGGVLVAFRKNGSCLGMYMYKLGGTHSTYTPFAFTFNPPLPMAPDTVLFAAVSSDVFSGIALNGSMLRLDSVSLTGAAQPTMLNGDFENWGTTTYDMPVSWYMNSDRGNGVAKTTDKNSGSFAVELTTYLGDNNGVPRAQSGGVSTGYYLNNCGGSNCQKGGYPFTNQIDTLCFYYKFAPLNGDTGQCWLNFKKNGNNVYGTSTNIGSPASSYMYKEIPFNTMTPVDTVIVNFQSSDWNDSTLASVGTVLKIDDVHFKSQPGTGIHSYDPRAARKIYPNPNNGVFTIENVDTHDLVRILNVHGQEVNAHITKQGGQAVVQVSTPGVYMVYINAQGKISQQRVAVGKE
jgi:hypothetical protein